MQAESDSRFSVFTADGFHPGEVMSKSLCKYRGSTASFQKEEFSLLTCPSDTTTFGNSGFLYTLSSPNAKIFALIRCWSLIARSFLWVIVMMVMTIPSGCKLPYATIRHLLTQNILERCHSLRIMHKKLLPWIFDPLGS